MTMVCMCVHVCVCVCVFMPLRNHFMSKAMLLQLKLPYSSSHVACKASVWRLPAGKLRDDPEFFSLALVPTPLLQSFSL